MRPKEEGKGPGLAKRLTQTLIAKSTSKGLHFTSIALDIALLQSRIHLPL